MDRIPDNTDVVFVPQPLFISAIPKLSVFPKDICFVLKENTRYFAIYVPRISTYTENGSELRMDYVNEGDPRARVTVKYDTGQKIWKGEKYFVTESGGSAFGINWDGFFIHLTSLGCDTRERVTELLDPKPRGGEN